MCDNVLSDLIFSYEFYLMSGITQDGHAVVGAWLRDQGARRYQRQRQDHIEDDDIYICKFFLMYVSKSFINIFT